MTPESLKQAANATKQMNLDEAYKILGSDSNAGIEEVMKVRHVLALCVFGILQQICCRVCNIMRSHVIHYGITAQLLDDVMQLMSQAYVLFAAICSSHAAK